MRIIYVNECLDIRKLFNYRRFEIVKQQLQRFRLQNFTLLWSISEDASEITPASASSAKPVKYNIRLSVQRNDSNCNVSKDLKMRASASARKVLHLLEKS